MDQARLKQLMTYSPHTGAFTWNEARGARKAGAVAGNPSSRQYRVEGKDYAATHLAWLFMTGEWPAGRIRFMNEVKGDLCWENLGLAASEPHRELTAEYLRERVHYDPETGVFTRAVPGGNIPIESEAGRASKRKDNTYVTIQINGRRYGAHRLAWLYMTGEWPPALVDHKNTDRQDNHWDNLRCATRTQNNWNSNAGIRNTTGFKGVSLKRGKYRARLMVNGKSTQLGTFDTPEAAHAVICAERTKQQGEFARH